MGMDTSVLTIIVTFGIFLFAQLSFFVAMVKLIVKPINEKLDNHITDTNKKLDTYSADTNKKIDKLETRMDRIETKLETRMDRIESKLDKLLSK